jgi:hypothetical protein
LINTLDIQNKHIFIGIENIFLNYVKKDLPEGETIINSLAEFINKNSLINTFNINNIDQNYFNDNNTNISLIEFFQIESKAIELLSKPFNYIDIKGKIYIKSLNQYKKSTISKIVYLIEINRGKIFKTFKSQMECGRFLKISETAIRKRLINKTQFEFQNAIVYLSKI